jgi:hypothetical protein
MKEFTNIKTLSWFKRSVGLHCKNYIIMHGTENVNFDKNRQNSLKSECDYVGMYLCMYVCMSHTS